MTTFADIAVPIAAYLGGGIPTAYILARATSGVDVRRVGTRNVGAANVIVHVGRWQGLAVLVMDMAKGGAAAGAATALGLPWWAVFAACVAALLGHNFSPFLRLYGGKGVAVVMGVFLVLSPALTASFGLSVAAVILAVTRNVVFAFALGSVAVGAALTVTGADAFTISLFGTLVAIVAATAYGRARREWHASVRAFVRRITLKTAGA
jgi:glycerol-3-phosphate acyltransferase PlsY